MFVDRQRTFINQCKPKWIVIHKTAGFSTIEQLGAYFKTNNSMLSSHYGVGRDGRIAQFVREKDAACANCCTDSNHASFLPDCDGKNKNLNMYTISIEHIDSSVENDTPVTNSQKAASFDLINNICDRYNIPKRYGDTTGGVIFHHDIMPVNKCYCPNVYPYDELWTYLKEHTKMNIPEGWIDTGKEL